LCATDITLYCPLPPPAVHPFPTRRSSDLKEPPLAHEASKHVPITNLGALELNAQCVHGFLEAEVGHERTHYTLHLALGVVGTLIDRKSTRLNSSHVKSSYAVFCLRKKSRV